MKPKTYWQLKRKAKVDAGRLEKYGNTKIDHAGYSFASKLEAAVFDILKWREKAGEIRDIQCQDSIYLTDARIEYRADFRFTVATTGEVVWAEAKGFENEKWPLKRRLWIYYGPGALEIYKGTYESPKLVEVLKPKIAIPKDRCVLCGRSNV